MSLDDLYREMILDHYRSPRNRGLVEGPDAEVRLRNPLCGDELTVQLLAGEDGRIREARFQGQGCSISQASASMMTEALRGKTLAEGRELLESFTRLMRGELKPGQVELGELEALTGVSQFPLRIKCALLAWEALDKGLAHLEAERGAKGGSRS